MADRRKLAAALAVAALMFAWAPVPVLAVTPINGGPFAAFSAVDIDISSGDQYDPHVNGDVAAYTSGTSIAYYNFATGAHAAIPGSVGTEDQLSDVSGGRIVFSRFDPNTFVASILVWDTDLLLATEIDHVDGAQRTNASIGADTVAFIDLSNSDLYAAQLGVPGSMQVTSDSRIDRQPQVAPAGNLIVYESCQLTSSNCDVHQATWSGTSWAITALTDNAEPESEPDTDGLLVVYDANRSGEKDIYWQPVGGGAEQRLALAGPQRSPSISAGVMAFESVAVGDTAADIYVYDTASNRLFQITSTPANEALNDIYVLPDGRVRVVFSSGEEGTRDVYGATMELPSTGPTFTFGGFLSPVDARPTLNAVKAGAAVPVKFSLGGDFGLSIFTAGNPRSQVIACDSTADIDPIEQTVTPGGSSLGYDAATGTYSYVWKSDKAWKGTCRQLVLGFADGSFQRAHFLFK